MSFQDIGRSAPPPERAPAAQSSVAPASNHGAALGGLLAQYDRNVDLLRTLLMHLEDGAANGAALEAQCLVLLELRSKAQRELQALGQDIQGMRSKDQRERVKGRADKLGKDFEKIRAKHALVVRQVPATTSATTPAAPPPAPYGRAMTVNQPPSAYPEERMSAQMRAQQRGQLPAQQLQAVEQEDLQDYLIRERAAEIQRINNDVQTINEIFKDLENIVENQNEGVEDIGRQMEAAHEHAARGLEQVQEANKAQQGCVMS